MPDYRTIAKKYIEGGFSVIPVNSRKNPSIPKWGLYQMRQMNNKEIEEHFKDCFGIGLLCGGPWRTVGIDFDLKYDLSGTLWERYKEAVPKELLKKMYVQTTKNKGYHFVFRAPKTRLFGNQKLAGRHTTAYERDETYREAFRNPETRDKATKMANNDKSRILIETRSGTQEAAGGYVLISPTEGYTSLYGKINEITEEEYDILTETARSFNEVLAFKEKTKTFYSDINWKLTPFEHYNLEGDVVQILLDSGWEIIRETNSNVRFKRPGQVTSNSSALFDKNTKTFNCFSTSCEFDVSRGYSPVDVLMLLEAEDNLAQCYNLLIDMDYGIKNE